MAVLREGATREAEILARAGVDGIIVENYGDAPFFPHRAPPETVAAMAVVVDAVREKVGVPVGVNVLRNDAPAALGIAAATEAAFIRVNVHTGSMFTDQGLIHGEAHATLRAREALGSGTAILADVMVKHATPPPGVELEEAALDAWHRGMADGLILTGRATGSPAQGDEVTRVKEFLPREAPVWVGSGVTSESVARFLEIADGVIVGSTLRAGGVAGSGLDEERVRGFMAAAGRG